MSAIVADASVIVKWFVEEDLQARSTSELCLRLVILGLLLGCPLP